MVASVLARLRSVAQEAGLSFNDILQSYVIERFLSRLSRSPHADTVLLKGALMLRVWGVQRARPTMDIDLLRRGVADQAALVRLVEQCAAISDPSDGVIFELTTISVEPIRDATEYVGTRIRLHARLGNVRQTVQIDFGVGDTVHPRPQVIDYPVLLTSPPVRLNAYPVEAAIAEKFEAMVHLDMQNSRMKDFYDIWILSRTLAFYTRRTLQTEISANCTKPVIFESPCKLKTASLSTRLSATGNSSSWHACSSDDRDWEPCRGWPLKKFSASTI